MDLILTTPTENVPGFGTLKMLTLCQIEWLRALHWNILMTGAERAPNFDRKAAEEKIDDYVGNLTMKQQAEAVLSSPSLLSKAVAYMVGGLTRAEDVSSRITPANRQAIEAVVVRSYGLEWGDATSVGLDRPPDSKDDDDGSPFDPKNFSFTVKMLARLYRLSPTEIGNLSVPQAWAWLPKQGEFPEPPFNV